MTSAMQCSHPESASSGDLPHPASHLQVFGHEPCSSTEKSLSAYWKSKSICSVHRTWQLHHHACMKPPMPQACLKDDHSSSGTIDQGMQSTAPKHWHNRQETRQLWLHTHLNEKEPCSQGHQRHKDDPDSACNDCTQCTQQPVAFPNTESSTQSRAYQAPWQSHSGQYMCTPSHWDFH